MSHRARHVLIGLCAVLVAELGALAVMEQGPVVTRGTLGPFAGTPPELARVATELGIPAGEMTRLQVRWGLPGGLRQPRPGYITAAYVGGHIFVAPTARPEDAVAYEYLHDVWAHLSGPKRSRVSVLLDQFYAERRVVLQPQLNELVRADVSNGADAGAARLDELHSIACSRTKDDHLDQPLRVYCAAVLPGRRITTKTY